MKILDRKQFKSLKIFWKQLFYSLYIIFHPFDGFWDMKHEKRGSLKAALVIVTLATLSFVFRAQYMSYIFNEIESYKINVFLEASKLLVPFILWCMVNYLITTLMDGEGTFKDIVTATGYALTPFILIYYALTLVSNVLTLSEIEFIIFMDAVTLIWMVFLVLCGSLTIHQYTMKKTVIISIFTVVGIGVIIFISLLFFTLTDRLVQFINGIYKEILFRTGG